MGRLLEMVLGVLSVEGAAGDGLPNTVAANPTECQQFRGSRLLSRRKDRRRFEAMKRLDPDYRGFRGRGKEPNRPGNTPLEAVTCRICGRRRNVPRGVALEHGDNYVCFRCTEEGHAKAVAETPPEP